MAARHRPNKKTQETIYRVYRLQPELKKRMTSTKERANISLRELIEISTKDSLPKLVVGLKSLGFSLESGKLKTPSRLPMTESTLQCLKLASTQCGGIPASRLLALALSMTCKGSK